MGVVKSFQVDHTILKPGFYISHVDGDITTYDMRFREPYVQTVLGNSALHSIEHLLASYFRETFDENIIIYFGPMGCQTGFYLLIRNRDADAVYDETEYKYPPIKSGAPTDNDVFNIVVDGLRRILAWEGNIPGNSIITCGNHGTLNLGIAKNEVSKYLIALLSKIDNINIEAYQNSFDYPVKEEED